MPNSLFLSSLLLLALSFQTSRTALVSGCRSNSDCPVASCCVLGMTRFGTPWCQSLRQLGDECRPRSELSVSRNLTYPNGFVLQLNDVHEVRRRLSDWSAQKRTLQYLISFFFKIQIMCPCDESLICDEHQGRCIPRELPALNGGNQLDESVFGDAENDV